MACSPGRKREKTRDTENRKMTLQVTSPADTIEKTGKQVNSFIYTKHAGLPSQFPTIRNS